MLIHILVSILAFLVLSLRLDLDAVESVLGHSEAQDLDQAHKEMQHNKWIFLETGS